MRRGAPNPTEKRTADREDTTGNSSLLVFPCGSAIQKSRLTPRVWGSAFGVGGYRP